MLVSMRLDPRVLEWLKSKGEGHLTRINDILTNFMTAASCLYPNYRAEAHYGPADRQNDDRHVPRENEFYYPIPREENRERYNLYLKEAHA